MNPALRVAISERDHQCDLLLVPPSDDLESAERVMARAADPAGFAHASELLEAAAYSRSGDG